MPVATQNARAGPSRGRHEAADEPEDGEERLVKPKVPEQGWTIDTFKDRPVVKSPTTLAAIGNLIQKLKDTKSRIRDGMDLAKDAACHMEEASPDDEMVGQFETVFQSGIDKLRLVTIKIEVLEQLNLVLRQNQPLEDPMGKYAAEVKQREEAYMSQTPRMKYKDDEDYQAFRVAVWEIGHDGEACPPMSAWLPREDGDVTDEEDDIEMGGQTQTYRCPITMRPFVDAVTSTECKHSYSKAAVMDIVQQSTQQGRRRPVKCPLPGCTATITKENLRDDKELQRRTDEAERRRRRREAEAEEEEDDDGDVFS